MKMSLLYLPLCLAAAATLTSSSNGVAEEQGRDRTGAPGSDPVCTSCHNYGGANVTASFEVVDGNSEVVSEYVPGQEYTVRMTISGGSAGTVYGVQGTSVLSDGSNAGEFTSVSSNAQLEDVDGRHIVEHSSSSATNSFEATWIAPEAGSGDADFYMSALAANGNGGTSGDTYTGSTLTLPEAGSSNVNALSAEWNAPTPVGLNRLSWTAPVRGTLTVMDLGGKVIHAQDLAENQRTQWAKNGISIVNFLAEDGTSQTWKIASH